MDSLKIQACNAYSKLSMGERPTLFVEFGCSGLVLNEQLDTFRQIAEGCEAFDNASDLDNAPGSGPPGTTSWACLQLQPDSKFLAIDMRPGLQAGGLPGLDARGHRKSRARCTHRGPCRPW